ncbi:TPA: hypothetical protein ACH3X1_004904 [Trebouxia sp. C0004]
MDNFLPELLDHDPIDAAVDSDDDDIDVSDVAPERVPDVKKLVRAKRAEHNKLLQKYGIHVWNPQQQYHVSFASNKCVITDRDKRKNALYLRIRTPTADPEDKSLVFDFKLTGKPAPNHTHVVYKRGTNSNDFLNRPLEEVNILKQTLYGAGTSRLPHLCYLEGTALPEEYFFGEQPLLTPSALADIGFRAESALAAWRNMVPSIASTAMQQPTRSDQDQITGMQTSAQQPLMSLFGITSLRYQQSSAMMASPSLSGLPLDCLGNDSSQPRSAPAAGGSSQQRPASTARAAAPQGFCPAVLLGNSRQRSGTTRVPAAAQKIASGVPGPSHQELGGAAAAQALQQLNLPPEQEVHLLMDLLKIFPSPARMPDFLKHRRKQSRATVPDDLKRPVKTAEEHALFHHCYQLHTNNKRTDWLGATRESSIAVCNTWDTTKRTCNLYLKNEHHMQDYSKEFLMQASHAEVNQRLISLLALWLASFRRTRVSATCAAARTRSR